MTPVEVLEKARAKIADPKNWIKGDFARDNDGVHTSCTSGDAVCFCTLGAINNVSIAGPARLGAITALLFYIPTSSCKGIPTFNDTHTHEEVLAVFDKAIALLRKPK